MILYGNSYESVTASDSAGNSYECQFDSQYENIIIDEMILYGNSYESATVTLQA